MLYPTKRYFNTKRRLRFRTSFNRILSHPLLSPLIFEMAVDGPSELPQHYGGKTTDGELVHRPSSPIMPSSPLRAYQGNRLPSPERTPIESRYPESENVRAGLRRRPSAGPPRRHSQGEYDRERPSFSSAEQSRRPLRSRDDGYYRDDDRGFWRKDDFSHPDSYERSRPPRTYRNVEWDRGPGSASKPYFDESRSDYHQRDVEKGWAGDSRMRESAESIDRYDYEANKRPGARTTLDFKSLTPEERKEVLRLPWTQWMNSNVKNRKCFHAA